MAANAAKPKVNQIAAISFMLLPNLFVNYPILWKSADEI